MEEDKKKVVENNEKGSKNKSKIIYTIIIILLLIIYIVLLIYIHMPWLRATEKATNLKNIRTLAYNNMEYYIITDDYEKEHEIVSYYVDNGNENRLKDVYEIMTYDQYVDFCTSRNIDVNYTDTSKNYIVFSYSKHNVRMLRLAEVDHLGEVENMGDVTCVYVWIDTDTSEALSTKASAVIIPTDITINTIVDIVPVYTEKEFRDTISGKEV